MLENGNGISDESQATVNVTSQMLTKAGLGYGYNTEGNPVITWRLTLNQNKMPMINALVTDTLPVGLHYIEDSATAGSAAYDSDTRVLSIALGNIEDTLVIEYATEVYPNEREEFKTSGDITISNEAVLTHEGMPEVIVSGSQKISNRLLNKTGDFDSAAKVISYTVEINPNGIRLEDQIVMDLLPNGLRLDIDSVTMTEALISAEGVYTIAQPGTIWEFDDTDVFDYSGFPEKFAIKIPNGTGRYILTYDCYIISETSFSNDIHFLGDESGGISGGDTSVVHVGSAGGGTSSKKARLVLEKQDSMRPGLKLAGVVFEVYQIVGTQEFYIMEVTTDQNGIADVYPLSANKSYVIREKQGAEGYLIDTLWAETSGNVEISDVLASEMTVRITEPGEYSLTLTNDPIINTRDTSGEFRFVKTTDRLVKGEFAPVNAGEATFKITDLTDLMHGTPYTQTAETDEDGVISFTDLPFGKYRVEEIITPAFHTKGADFTIEVHKDGKITGLPVSGAVNNVYFRPDLIITKMGAADGIEFALFEDGSEIEKKTTSGGKVTFADLYGGYSYIVRETVNPAPGYYQTGEHGIPEVNQAGDYSLSWQNYPHAAQLSVTKADSLRTGVKLAGATFRLYDNEGDAEVVAAIVTAKDIEGLEADTRHIDEQTTAGSSGLATFTGLKLTQDTSKLTINSEPALLPTTYWLVEIAPPAGYDLNPAPQPVTLNPTGSAPRTATYTYTAYNTPTEYQNTSLTFTKYSDKASYQEEKDEKDNQTLAGAVFTMVDQTVGSNYTIVSNTSSGDGVIRFEDIPFGTYKVVETTVPQYHQKVADFYVTFDETGNCTKFGESGDGIAPFTGDFLVTNQVINVTATITKTDADTGGILNDVPFILTESGEGKYTAPAEQGTIAGQTSFTDLLGGNSYTIKETVPPGYYLAKTLDIEAIESGENIVLAWQNYPYAASVTVTKQDFKRPGVKIPGAIFRLYDNKSVAEAVAGMVEENDTEGLAADTGHIDEQSTVDPSGVATFTGLKLTQTGLGSWSKTAGVWRNGEPAVEDQAARQGQLHADHLGRTCLPDRFQSRRQGTFRAVPLDARRQDPLAAHGRRRRAAGEDIPLERPRLGLVRHRR